MKIRTDFVTNSSSSSYVVVEIKSKMFKNLLKKYNLQRHYISFNKDYDIRFLDNIGYNPKCAKSAGEIADVLVELLDSIGEGISQEFIDEYKSSKEKIANSIQKANYSITTKRWGEFDSTNIHESDDYSFIIDKTVDNEGNILCINDANVEDLVENGCLIIPAKAIHIDLKYALSEYDIDTVDVHIDNTSFCMVDGVLFNRDKTALIFYQNNKQADYTVPSSVKIILEQSFCDCTNIESIFIPDTVEEIESFSFTGCKNLKKVRLPSGLKNINDGLFMDCEALESINVPKSVENIGTKAFAGSGIKELVIPKNVKKIGERILEECPNIDRLIIEGNFISDGWLFGRQRMPREIIVKEGVTQLGFSTGVSMGFEGQIKKIVLPNTLEKINNYMFLQCVELEEIVIPKSVKEIGVDAFQGCDKLRLKVYEDSVGCKYAQENGIPFEIIE